METKTSVSSTITTRSSEKPVQSNSSRGRRLVVDYEREDLSQATPAGNDTSIKLAVQFELPETATNTTTRLNLPSPSPSTSTSLIVQELIQQSLEQK